MFANRTKNSLILLFLFFFSVFAARGLEGFRYSNYRWIYTWGTMFSFFVHFTSVLLSIINSVEIVFSKKKIKFKWGVLLISLFPLLYWILGLVYISMKNLSV
ncbi:hypothetical protein [Apibacter sp. HY039]|uniref:hypothetical protein n=1 Tax=Apibacter sp. HY039 TaxID=2501476 RepID=UPI000FEBA700|nr:hypothetical protein [Apibacter sp. HY039]